MTVLSTYPTYHPSTPPTVWLTTGNFLNGTEFLVSTNSQPLIFKTNANERMRITSTGSIGINNNNPDPSAILDIVSTTTGILIPRLTTTQRNSIVRPATGLLIYNTTTNSFDYYDGTAWQTIITASSTVPFNLISSGTNTSANMIVGAGATFTTNDNAFTIRDEADNTKQAQFQASGITTSTTRTYTLPDANGTLALLDISQTFAGTQTFNNVAVTGNVASNLVPSTTNNYDLGSSSNKWKDGYFAGHISIDGNTTLGDGTSDNVVFNATVASNVVPDGNATRNLGNASTVWNTVYANGIRSTNDGFRLVYYPSTQKAFFDIVDQQYNKPIVTIGPFSSGSTLENGGIAVKERTDGSFRGGVGWNGNFNAWLAGVGDLNSQNGATLYWASNSGTDEPRILVANGNLQNPVFSVDREGDLVASSAVITGNTTLGDASTDKVTFNASVASDVLPDASATRNLGSINNLWNYIYAKGIRSDNTFRLLTNTYPGPIYQATLEILDASTGKQIVTIGPASTSSYSNGGIRVNDRTTENPRGGLGWNPTTNSWNVSVGNADNYPTIYGVTLNYKDSPPTDDPRIAVFNGDVLSGSPVPVFLVDKEGDVLTNTFRATGSVHYPVTSVNATTNLDATHFLVLVDASSGAVTVNLPQASTCTGRMYVIMKIDNIGNSVTIDPDGSETINGFTTISITSQWGKYVIMSTGSSWVAW